MHTRTPASPSASPSASSTLHPQRLPRAHAPAAGACRRPPNGNRDCGVAARRAAAAAAGGGWGGRPCGPPARRWQPGGTLARGRCAGHLRGVGSLEARPLEDAVLGELGRAGGGKRRKGRERRKGRVSRGAPREGRAAPWRVSMLGPSHASHKSCVAGELCGHRRWSCGG
eukprot:364367-Chlamydomonas_euryale.AAC.8